jgi:K+-sensing histidine kinase KdpD
MEGMEIIKTPVLFLGDTNVSDLPKKLTAIWLRWPVVIICSYLLVYSGGEWLSFATIYSFLLIYVLSNAALYFIGEKLFSSSYFYTTLFSFDTLFLTACLVITGKMGTDFYLAYFLIIIVASICQNFRGLIVVALLAPLLYGFILFRTTETFDSSIYLRLPFLFVISLFYGYFAELLRIDMEERDETSKQLEHHQQRQDALYDINLAVTSTLNLQAIQDVLLEKIYLLLPYIAASSLTLFHKGSDGVEILAYRDIDGEEWKASIKKRCGNLTEVVAETKSPLIVSNLQTDPQIEDRQFFRGLGLVSYLGLPLVAKTQVLGVLSLFTKEQHQFNGEEAKFLTALASHAAIAIHNSQLYEQTKRQAVELERAFKVREEFLSVISHELRTPLNVVIGYAGMMKD